MSPSLLRPSRAWSKLTHAQAQPMVSRPESVSADREPKPTQSQSQPSSKPDPPPMATTARPPVPVSAPAPAPVPEPSNTPAPHHHRSRSRYGGTGRSHHGGATSSSSYAHMNEFPVFSATGDVEIVIRASGQERRYLLHRLILSQCSGFFEAGMSEEWGARSRVGDDGLSVVNEDESDSGMRRTTSRSTAARRWRYELDWEDKEDYELPILVQKTPTANNATFTGEMSSSSRPPTAASRSNKPATPHQGFFRTMANLTGIQSALHLPGTATAAQEQPVDPTIRDYDNLFRIFYNHAPHLNSVNIATAYAECKSLLTLADMYDALPVTGPRVDHHLLRFSSRLYKQIAKYPPSYLKLGYLARSKVIFSEALIHVVGQWPAALPHLGPNSYSPLPDHVLDLIEDKVDDMDDAIARIESKLFRLTLTTSRGERVSPSNAYIDWLAVSLFRQWLVENTTPPPASILKTSPQPPTTTTPTTNPTTTPPSANQSRQLSSASPNPNPNPNSSRPSSRPGSGTGARTGTANKQHQPKTPPFSIGRTYRLLGSPSSQAYLPHDELKRFLKLQPALYTRENMRRFERKVDEIKRLAREIVKPVMRNFLELDLRALAGGGDGDSGGGGGDGGMLLPYLTCTRVGEGDFPWEY